jgi:anaerobic selenocysteine-containing dehydrogenase
VSARDGIHHHICSLCEAGCGLVVTVRDGRVDLIRGDRDDVSSHGYLCAKGTALKDLQDDPDRLRHPMVNDGGALRRSDTAEAFARIERLLRPIIDEHGPDAVGFVVGNPAVHRTGIELYLLDLFEALGSRNVFTSASLDQLPKQVASGLLFGDFGAVAVPDIDRTDLLVVIGANPVVSNGSMWTVPDAKGRLRALRARGGRLVVIDPRRTETAELADVHLAPRPGTDAVLLAAVANTVLADGLASLGAIDGHVNGIDEVRVALAPFTVELAAGHCGLDPSDIRELARELAAAPSAAVYGRMGTTTQRHGTTTSWLVDVLNVITGNLDRPGGAMFSRPAAFGAGTADGDGPRTGVTVGRYRSRVSGLPEMTGQLPLSCLAEEILTPGEGRIRALVTIAANPALSAPDSAAMQRALASLDALVCLDVYVNETTRHADVIVPGPSPLETAHFDAYFAQHAVRNTARTSGPALEPPSTVVADDEAMLRLISILAGGGWDGDLDALDDRLTTRLLGELPPEVSAATLGALEPRRRSLRRVDLGLRAGPYGDGFGARPGGLSLSTVEAAPSGIDLGPLEPRLPELLRTVSGRIELAPPMLIESLRAVLDESAQPESFGLSLIGRRHVRSNNSWMHNLPVLAKGADRCTALVHPDDATRAGVVDGDAAEVVSEVGAIEIVVRVDGGIRPGVISIPHGWGHDLPDTRLTVASRRPGANVNVLLESGRRDLLTGTAAFNAVPVLLRPLREAAGE